jgi:ornithine decarboxylase
MYTALKAGFTPNELLYANTMKGMEDLKNAIQIGITKTTTDSVEGIEQLHTAYKELDLKPRISVIVRLAVDDSQSRSPFSIKYGATERDWLPILRLMNHYKLPFGGVSFHVGSGSSNPEAFVKAIQMCRQFRQVVGHPIPMVDIGGGFLPSEESFLPVAKAIRAQIKLWETQEISAPNRWIAEPGRFFSAPTQSLTVPILFKKSSEDRVRYVIDESIYGQFSNIVFDHGTPPWSVVRNSSDATPTQSSKKAFFFGRTCDSLDLIAIQENAPEYEVGDQLIFPWMGAYTNASATTFNGFALPEKYYVDNDKITFAFNEQSNDTTVMYPIQTTSKVSLSTQRLA